MPETNVQQTLKDEIKDRQQKLRLDRRGMYEILLGPGVVDSMVEALGEEQAKQFLDAHHQFDVALDKAKGLDLFELIPVHQITAFKSFTEYVAMLRTILSKLSLLKDDEAEVVKKALSELLELAAKRREPEANPAPEAATAGAEMLDNAPKYGSKVFRGRSIPGVPLSPEQRELLPYSYPDFDETMGTVLGHCKRIGFHKDLFEELNTCTRKSLAALAAKRKYVDHVESDYCDYLVEAQTYLRDVNWLNYGVESRKLVTAALERGAKVEIDRRMGTVVVSCVKTEAYAFLGVNLEMVLRRAVVTLAKDALSNYFFEGRQSGVDTVVGVSSRIVQDYALEWLERLTTAFDEKSE